MIFTFSIILVAWIIICAINMLVPVLNEIYPNVLLVIPAVIVTTLAVILVDGLTAILVHNLPEKWFAADNKRFDVSNKSRKFYEKIKIRKWKDKVWELGAAGGFSKKTIASPNDPKYIEKFLIECNKGVVVHRVSYITGFLCLTVVLPFLPWYSALAIGVPIGLVNILINSMSAMILRYNTPKLQAVYKRLKKRGNDE